MKLSGWTRLWIVASVVWWAAGGWWLYENFRPDYVQVTPAVYPPPPPLADMMASRQAAIDEANRLLERLDNPPKSEKEIYDDIKRMKPLAPRAAQNFPKYPDPNVPIRPATFRDDWTSWLFQAGGVIAAPFVAALAFMLLRRIGLWVWRGFRPTS